MDSGFSESETTPNKNKLNPTDQYSLLLKQYHKLRKSFSAPVGMHTALISQGEQMGKNKEEVLMDLTLMEGNLIEYDLPDMAVQEIDFEFPFVYKLTYKNGIKTIGNELEVITESRNKQPHLKYLSTNSQSELNDWLKTKHLFLPWYGFWGGERDAKNTTPAYGLKKTRLIETSRDLEFDVYYRTYFSYSADFHWPMQLTGLVIPLEQLDNVAKQISSNKGKYWLSDSEKKDLYSSQILAYDDTEQLREYMNDLINKMLGIREAKNKDWHGWLNLLNVANELQIRTGTNVLSLFRSYESLWSAVKTFSTTKEITNKINILEKAGKLKEAGILKTKYEAVVNG